MSKAAQLAALIGSGQAQGDKNLIINGAQNVAQRGTAAVTVTTTAGFRCVDRFKTDIDGSSGGDFSHAQVEDAPIGQGFRYASKITTVTQASQPTSEGNRHQLYTILEKQNTFHLDWGTSAAKTCTLSFWVKGSVTGIYNMMFAHYGGSSGSDTTYYYYTNYTIDSANTWEKKTITVTGPTVGGNERANNTFGTRVEWLIGVGSDAETGTLNEWTTSSTYRLAPNSVYLPENAGATLYITGVQFEIGEQSTPFEHEDFGTTFAKCQRYFQNNGGTRVIKGGYAASGGNNFYTVKYTTAMRAAPTVTYVSVSGSGFSNDDPTTQSIGTESFEAYKAATSTVSGGYFLFTFTVDAELQMNITSAQYYNDISGSQAGIKANIDGTKMQVPLDPANRHYAEIMRQVAAGELTIADAD